MSDKKNGSNLPTIYSYSEKNKLNVISINEEPWFVAKDVCEALSISRPSDIVEKLDDDEKLMRKVSAAGQNREMWLVNESGLYNLIFRSNKPEAKAFRKWVTNTVLPAIRKQGSYSITPAADTELNQLVANAATVVGGSLNKLAGRIGISAAVLTFLRTQPQLVSPNMLTRIETSCRHIVNHGSGSDMEMINLVMKIADNDTRLALWSKLQKGGMV